VDSSFFQHLLKHFPTAPFRVHNSMLCAQKLSESHPLAFDAVMPAYKASEVVTEQSLLNMRVPRQVWKVTDRQVGLARRQRLLDISGPEAERSKAYLRCLSSTFLDQSWQKYHLSSIREAKGKFFVHHSWVETLNAKKLPINPIQHFPGCINCLLGAWSGQNAVRRPDKQGVTYLTSQSVKCRAYRWLRHA
jgi:hypothetical protein